MEGKGGTDVSKRHAIVGRRNELHIQYVQYSKILLRDIQFTHVQCSEVQL
jgi:hypothetical protein